MDQPLALPQAEVEARNFIVKVYNWMTAGLAITGGIAWYMASNPQMILNLIRTPFLFFGLLIAEFLAVIWLAGWVHKMSSSTASLIFLSYAALNGVTMSVIFLVYTKSSIANAFFVTAGTFGVMSFYGYTTKTDLTGIGNLCFMGLVGIIIASFANFFFHSARVDWITTYAGVLIFVGLTAYDTQKIKNMNVPADDGTDAETRDAISGALALYLDFINLFLDLLKIMGKRRD
jgi:FtsH-binding integral membrane protein